jgi:hypothetical protein
MAVFWDVASCSQVDTDRRFRGALSSIIRVMMKAVSSSETSINIYQTTRCYIQEDSYLHTRRRKILKFHPVFVLLARYLTVCPETCITNVIYTGYIILLYALFVNQYS